MATSFPNHIKIAVNTIEKEDIYAIQNEDGTILYTFEARFIRLLSQILRFSYLIIPSNDGTVGSMQDNGSWTGLFGMLEREEADLAISYLVIQDSRLRVVDFSAPYMFTDITFLTHNPEPLPKSFAILYPFAYETWFTFAIFFFVASLIFHVFLRKAKSYQYVILKLLGSVLEQGLELNMRSWSRRFFLIIWILSAMFLSYAYKALLLSFMTFQPTIGIRTTPELAKAVKAGTHTCHPLYAGSLAEFFMNANDPDMVVLGKSLEENSKGYIEPDILKLMRIKKPKSAIIYARDHLRVYQNRFYLSQSSFLTINIGTAVRKTFCCKKKLDDVVRRVIEAGIYEKLVRDFELNELSKMGIVSEDFNDTHSLSLNDLLGALIIFLTGHCLALVVFAVELIVRTILK